MALALLAPQQQQIHGPVYGTIASVAPGTAAARAGLRPGDRLLSVNGHRLRDVIDFRFYTADDELLLEVRRDGDGGDGDSDVQTIALTHGPEDLLGLELRGDGLESITECTNHCPFCFVTQLPPGMRRTLQIKDDDYRYSFLFASFVTLTNLTPEDWARIEEQRLSPLYVSVHSTDVAMRRKLLGNKFAEDPLAQLDRLAAMGVTVHTQLVTCPGINDGEHFERSVEELLTRYPQVQTIAAVPVGLTKVRTERTMSRGMPLRKFRPDEAARLLAQVERFQECATARHGAPIVHASDELYLLAGRTVPEAAHYEDMEEAQLENGVGLTRQLIDDWRRVRSALPAALPRPRHLTMACGTLIAPVLQEIVDEMNGVGNLRVDLRPVRNTLFGDEVTVSGLIVGRDLLGALDGHEVGDTVVLPRDMFDHSGRVTLDDMARDDLVDRLGKPIVTVKRFTELREVLLS